MVDAFFFWPCLLLAVVTLPGTIELVLLTVGAVLPQRRAPSRSSQHRRLAVVIPAHNEELNVARCVRSVVACAAIDAADVVLVVADNCSDRTADEAKAAGAVVLQRDDSSRQGKGYALMFGFEALLSQGYDMLCVVDADSTVAPNFIARLRQYCAPGVDAVQGRYLARNPEASIYARLQHVALLAFNLARPRGRAAYGWSCGVFGNGFAVSADTLRAVPIPVASIVEDLEYHLRLVWAARRVTWADDLEVRGDMPVSTAQAAAQRARWEGGRWRVVVDWVPRLTAGVLRGRWQLCEPLLDLLLLPLSFHAAILFGLLVVTSGVLQLYALLALLVVIVHVAVALAIGRSSWRDVAALLIAPLYMLWKLSTLPHILRASRRGAPWRRSERA